MKEMKEDKNLDKNEKERKVIEKEKNILIVALACMSICFAMNLEGIIRFAINGNNFWIFYLICEIISVSAIIVQIYALIKIKKTLKRLLKQNSLKSAQTTDETKNEKVKSDIFAKESPMFENQMSEINQTNEDKE